MTTTATYEAGCVRGVDCGDHVRFLGVPYAAPPTGARRFLPPAQAEPFTGERDASQFGAAAMQGATFAPGVLAEGPQDEDCLTLNLFIPKGRETTKRPVMVWLHGGAFIVGTAVTPLYDGSRLATTGEVIVVTLNYRLGALGYVDLGEPGRTWGARANLGVRDQVAALAWVQRNIASFGGDPDNVTLFGESAGAASVLAIMASPLARGLLHRAIVQSPPPVAPAFARRHAKDAATQLLTAAGLDWSRTQALQSLSTSDIMRAQSKVKSPAYNWPHFQPLVDDEVLPGPSVERFRAGQAARVPLLIGYNLDEWNLFDVARAAEWAEPLDASEAESVLCGLLPDLDAAGAKQLLDVYRGERKARRLPADNRALLRAIQGDLYFRSTAISHAEAHAAAHNPTYTYVFTQRSPALRGALGACHALELGFVFGTLDAPNQRAFAGSGDAVEQLSRRMMHAWTRFAHTGVPDAGNGLRWQPYTADARHTLIWNEEPSLESDPFASERQALQQRSPEGPAGRTRPDR